MNHNMSCMRDPRAAAKAGEVFSQDRDTNSSGRHEVQETPSEPVTDNYRNILQGTQMGKKVTVLMAKKHNVYCWYFQLRAISSHTVILKHIQ